MSELIIYELILYIAIGIISGTIAGLFGLGGGVIIVPLLFFSFSFLHFPHIMTMHFTLGTSFAIMIWSSLSSARSHHKRNDILWPIFFNILPGLVFGVILGAYLAHILHTSLLSAIFGILLLFLAIQMFISIKSKKEKLDVPTKKVFLPFGLFSGIISGLTGTGSGSLTIPFLNLFKIKMKNIVGTSSMVTFPVAIIGTLSNIYLGWDHAANIQYYSLGYIYLPALICIAPFAIIFAPIGTKLQHRTNSNVLRKILALAFVIIGLKMILMAFGINFFSFQS